MRYCSGDNLKERENLVVTEYSMENGALRIGNHISFGKHVDKEDIPGIFFNSFIVIINRSHRRYSWKKIYCRNTGAP